MYNIVIKGQVRPDGTTQDLVADFSHDGGKDCRSFNVEIKAECLNSNGNVVGQSSTLLNVNLAPEEEGDVLNVVDAAVLAARVVNRKATASIIDLFNKTGIDCNLLTDVNWKESVDKVVEESVKAAA